MMYASLYPTITRISLSFMISLGSTRIERGSKTDIVLLPLLSTYVVIVIRRLRGFRYVRRS